MEGPARWWRRQNQSLFGWETGSREALLDNGVFIRQGNTATNFTTKVFVSAKLQISPEELPVVSCIQQTQCG